MRASDVISSLKVMEGAQAWFSEVLATVAAELYRREERDSQGSRAALPLTVLPGGLMHLRAAWRGNFSLQAYVDAAGAPGQAEGPLLWWELVSPPRGAQPSREVPATGIDELPHRSMEGWEGEFADGIGCFTGEDAEGYRYVALAHAPADWERRGDVLAQAWGEVLEKLRDGKNFSRQWCRGSLRAALAQG